MEVVNHPSKNSLLLRSIVNILFGLLILAFPGLSLLIIAIAFAANLLVIGLFMIFEPAFDNKNKHAVLTVILGLLSVGAGVYLLSRPLTSISVLSLLIAIWALFYGIIDLFLGFKLTEMKKPAAWLFLAAGVLSLVFGIYLAFNPLEGSLALVWVLGAYSLFIGILLAYHSFADKDKSTKPKAVSQKAPAKKRTKKKGAKK